MIKRLILGVFFCFVAAQARAVTCTTNPACTLAAPCDWNSPATWSCGHVPSKQKRDICIVMPDTSVMLRTDGLGCGNTEIDGTFTFDETSAGRDPDGYRTFTVVGDITANGTGVLRMRAGDRLAFDTGARPRVFQASSGFVLDIQGQVQETTIAGLVDGPPIPVDCGAGAPGREYTITPAGGTTLAHKSGRIVFQSGRARNRHLEIRAVSGGSLRVCTDTLDATSGSDTSGGQRLTPHADRNAFCTAVGTPSSCCTGARRGNCPAPPVSRHSEPAPYGASACTGPRTPYLCCTGAGTGQCTGAIPAVGDRIAIVHDAWIFQVGGTNGYRIQGEYTGNAPMPIFRAVNIANAGTHSVTSTSGVEFHALAGVSTVDVEFVNFHDHAPDIDGFRYFDVRDWTVRWSAFHDVTPNTQRDTQATLAAASQALAADNVTYEDNIFYRTQGVGPHLNEAGSLPAKGCRFLRNLLFDSCLSGVNECGGLQADNCTGGEAAYNVVYDYYPGGNAAAFTLGMHGVGATMHHNWVVNGGFGPGAVTTDPAQIEETSLTHNYVSHMVADGAEGGRYYSNIIRNFGLGLSRVAAGIVNPIKALGNYILGVEREIQSSPDCAADKFCGGVGIRYIRSLSNSNKRPTLALDNIVASLASSPVNSNTDGRCVEFDGYDLTGGGALDADWDATVDHVTCDGRGPAVPIRGVSFDQNNATISPSVTVLGRDLVFLFNNDGWAVKCTAQAEVDEVFQNLHSLRSGSQPTWGGDYVNPSECTSAPAIIMLPSLDYQDSLHGNYNFLPGSINLVSGIEPPGSPIGARAFRFDRSSLQSLWATDPSHANDFCTGQAAPSPCCSGAGIGTCSASIISFDGEFPADIANVDNQDSDGDGVIDLHDNSPAAWNPDQLDADGDGFGAASDCNDSNPSIHPGAVDVCNGLDDDCDGLIDNGPGTDLDHDLITDTCDNCPLIWNPDQQDTDSDGEGDVCDLNDGYILIRIPDRLTVSWQMDTVYESFNEYRGDLAVLQTSGQYTQDPLVVPSARRTCNVATSPVTDGPDPVPGQAFFYLVSGVHNGIEGSLGMDSSGAEHPNANPCPAP